MRSRCAALAFTTLAACSKAPPPTATSVVEPTPVVVEEPVVLPTVPTPAFVPSDNGSCLRAYKLHEGTCVHRFYEQTQPGGLAQALAAYRRGAAPPMLGPVPLPRAPERRPKAPLDPGSLTKRKNLDDAGSPRDRRLADLDVMLAAAREKLRQREEAAKAKQVPNAPKREAARPSPDTLGAMPPSFAAASANADPAQARLSELNQLANQLSGDQLRALTAELGRSGINTQALEDILRHEGGDDLR